MKVKFETVFRTCIILLLVLLIWSVWQASAQAPASEALATNAPAGTNVVAEDDSVITTTVSRFSRMIAPDWIEDAATRVPFLQREWLGNPIWKYLASLIYIFLAFYVSKLVDYLTRVWLGKLAARTETKFDDLLLDLLRGPVKVVCFVILLHLGLSVFEWPHALEVFFSKGLQIIVAVSLTYMALKFVDLAIGYWRQRRGEQEDQVVDKQLLPVLRKTLKVFICVVAALVTAQNLGLNITGLVASLGIGGLAVALAAQDTLANVFGAVAIFLDKPFRVGDRVQLDGVDGPVESIGLRSTRIRNLEGHLITVPNKTIGNATITNISRRPNIRTLMNIGITYDTPTEKVKRALKIIEEVYKDHPKSFNCIISFNKFESSSLNILVVHWWNSTDFIEYLGGIQEMNLSLKERFDAEGISFAFPTQTLHVKQDSEWRLEGGGSDPVRLPT